MNLIDRLKNGGGNHTINEVMQQTDVWEKVRKNLSSYKKIYSNVVESNATRVVFTGAGSSEYIGSCIYRYLNNSVKDFQFEVIANTDIVVNPRYYFNEDERVILVSFGRSGNSPESLQAMKVVEQVTKNVVHIVITCNKDGKMAEYNCDNLVVLPDETHDRGFAMTSSFTTMMLSAIMIFTQKEFDFKNIKFDTIMKSVESLELENKDRFIYLGDGDLTNVAEESALKILELCAGEVVSAHYTPLGFRHGPKSIINDKTVTIVFMHSDELTRKYEYDLIKELASDNRGNQVIVVDYKNDSLLDDLSKIEYINLDYKLNDCIELNFLYMIWGQLLSLSMSIAYGITPDEPCSDNAVNRVVQGVILHDL